MKNIKHIQYLQSSTDGHWFAANYPKSYWSMYGGRQNSDSEWLCSFAYHTNLLYNYSGDSNQSKKCTCFEGLSQEYPFWTVEHLWQSKIQARSQTQTVTLCTNRPTDITNVTREFNQVRDPHKHYIGVCPYIHRYLDSCS